MIFNSEMEAASRPVMQKLQLERLKNTVERVYANVPFYQRRFKELGIEPKDIQSLDDITKLPFTYKKDLRDHYPYGLFATPMKDIVRIHASSGTSGKPTVVGYTKKDIENWGEMVARSIVSAGGRPGDVFHNAYGYGLFTGGLGLHYGAEALGCATVPISGGNTDRQITVIQDFLPRGISATPSYALNIAEKMIDMGLNPRESSLEYGIFGAEPWSEEMRQTLEDTWGLKAIDIYGLSEVVGPGVGIECYEAQNGLHVPDDHFIVEVLDPKTGEPVPEGEIGELTFTSLTKEAFPVLRYRTGDLASITTEKCICGRTSTRMSRLKGRIDDMIIIRGVNVFPSEIEFYLLQIPELVPHYQIQLVKHGSLDAIVVQVEMSPEFFLAANNNPSLVSTLKRKVQHSLKNNCLISVEIEILSPKALPRFDGKAVRIIDKRNMTIEA